MKFTIFSILALAMTAVASPTPEAHSIAKRDYGGGPSTGEVCPQAQDLFYHSASGAYYQIACAVDTTGGTNLAVYIATNILQCAQYCDDWNTNKQAGQDACNAVTNYPTGDGVIQCLIQATTSGWYAYEVSASSGIESAMLA